MSARPGEAPIEHQAFDEVGPIERQPQGVPTTHGIPEIARGSHGLSYERGARGYVGGDRGRSAVTGCIHQHDLELLSQSVGELAPAPPVLGEAVNETDACTPAVHLGVQSGGHRAQT